MLASCLLKWTTDRWRNTDFPIKGHPNPLLHTCRSVETPISFQPNIMQMYGFICVRLLWIYMCTVCKRWQTDSDVLHEKRVEKLPIVIGHWTCNFGFHIAWMAAGAETRFGRSMKDAVYSIRHGPISGGVQVSPSSAELEVRLRILCCCCFSISAHSRISSYEHVCAFVCRWNTARSWWWSN